MVGTPDPEGAEEVMKAHMSNYTVAEDVEDNLDAMTAMCAGASGADIAAFVNEGAIVAARRNADIVTLGDYRAAHVQARPLLTALCAAWQYQQQPHFASCAL